MKSDLWPNMNLTTILFASSYDNILAKRIENCQNLAAIHCAVTGISHSTYNTEVSIFPNPFSGIVSINLQNLIFGAKICIYDLFGNCIKKKKDLQMISPQLILNAQAKGIYILETSSKNQISRKKIILQ